MIDNYRIQHSYFVDRGSPEFKAPWNTLVNNARVYTPDDKAIQTPNSDTPYSYVGADLRAEPLVFTVPAVEKGRYYALQFIDMYTFDFAYVGSRATGNGAGSYLLAGPRWQGRKPNAAPVLCPRVIWKKGLSAGIGWRDSPRRRFSTTRRLVIWSAASTTAMMANSSIQ